MPYNNIPLLAVFIFGVGIIAPIMYIWAWFLVPPPQDVQDATTTYQVVRS